MSTNKTHPDDLKKAIHNESQNFSRFQIFYLLLHYFNIAIIYASPCIIKKYLQQLFQVFKLQFLENFSIDVYHKTYLSDTNKRKNTIILADSERENEVHRMKVLKRYTSGRTRECPK